ncbi:osmotically inducible protein OsmC [Roseivivax halotolerans]|jgi:osmotically inducible protein OsmC|uniref:Osmotically inducible protein OsmC n=1 Tax=Roseivivax halotolerans TaxID=93684 RepID=A0A1I5XQV1_9RHOB|nr:MULTISPECIES: OsmC family protein [Roseivivax]QFT62392.1 Peroxiredoxin OsmC [Roseivivax sp. THAF30]SFQ34345.1 osmotically inducible protein OsmC [Roseivivax halotolerans]
MAIEKFGTAHWSGDLQSGTGEVSTESGALDKVQYGFNKRFEGEPGSNPEELVGAAHASCYSMALSMILGNHDVVADDIDTKATVSLEKDGDGFSVTKVHLDVTAKVPGLSEDKFMEAANAAKDGCPISKLYAGGTAEITMDAKLA